MRDVAMRAGGAGDGRRRTLLGGLLALLLALIAAGGLAGAALAAAGELDTSFNGDGWDVYPFSSTSLDEAKAVALQPSSDGETEKIIAAGVDGEGTDEFAVVRLNEGGLLDASFNGTGRTTATFPDPGVSGGSADAGANDVAVQPDGKVVVVGEAGGEQGIDTALARFNRDGTPDTSFGGNAGSGRRMDNLGGANSDGTKLDDSAETVALQPDGKLVVAGSKMDPSSDVDNFLWVYDMFVTRYNADGSLDTSFGSGGSYTFSYDESGKALNSRGHDVAILPGGRIVVVGGVERQAQGSLGAYPNWDIALASVNQNGTADAQSFKKKRDLLYGGNTTEGGYDEVAEAITVQKDGKFVLAGGALSDIFVARYNADGTPDSAFARNYSGGSGYLVEGFGTSCGFSCPKDEAYDVTVQPWDGGIVVAGSSEDYDTTVSEFALARYGADGSADNEFDSDGDNKVTTSLGSETSVAYGMAMQKDGKIVTAGQASDTGDGASYNFAFARYQGDDITPPSAPSITSPANGATLTSRYPTISGTAEAGSTIKVYDGSTEIGTSVTSNLGSWSLRTPSTALDDGSHSITATATDKAGNVSPASSGVSLTVDTTPPGVVTALSAKPGDRRVDLSWTNPTNSDLAYVRILRSDAGYTNSPEPKCSQTNPGELEDPEYVCWKTVYQGTNQSFSDTSLVTNGTTYYYTVFARDKAGNWSQRAETSATPTAASPDTTPPTVSLTAPADGTTVSGSSVTLSADATDDKAVSRVDFYVGSTKVGSDTTAGGTSGKEYSYTWDSKTVSNGSQNITAHAYDAANNEKISSSRSITVNNTTADTTVPTISLTSPAEGATVSGSSVDLKAEASDNVGVADVRFYIWKDSEWSLVGTDTTAGGTSGKEYSYTWDSTTVSDGTNYFYAHVRDAAGNNTTASRTITVSNTADTTAPEVLTFDPHAGQTGVQRSKSITVEFNEEMAPYTINTSNLKLQQYNKKKKKWLTVTNVVVSCDNPCKTATLDPHGTSSTLLKASTRHRVTVSYWVKDKVGNYMSTGRSAIFTTGTS